MGTRILGAVEATFAAIGTNTNLGIIDSLCAPLSAAAEAANSRSARSARQGVRRVLTRKMRTLHFAPSYKLHLPDSAQCTLRRLRTGDGQSVAGDDRSR